MADNSRQIISLKSAASCDSEVIDTLSVDVEDYFHVEAFADRISPETWSSFESRVRRNTETILSLLQQYNCRATFFLLGWVAEREKTLVKEIAKAGHEIACHGYAHRRVTDLTRAEFRNDVRRARAAIEDAVGVAVHGFRAPTFSVVAKTLWALDVLAEEGFTYDSSIFPIRHDLYGFPDAPRSPHRRKLANGLSILEFPMSTVRLLGLWNVPVGGGGYLRILPMSYTRWAIRRLHRNEKQSVMIYLHPWEVDPQQPRLPGKWRSKFRHYRNLNQTTDRLDKLLAAGRFEPLIAHAVRLDPSVSSVETRTTKRERVQEFVPGCTNVPNPYEPILLP